MALIYELCVWKYGVKLKTFENAVTCVTQISVHNFIKSENIWCKTHLITVRSPYGVFKMTTINCSTVNQLFENACSKIVKNRYFLKGCTRMPKK